MAARALEVKAVERLESRLNRWLPWASRLQSGARASVAHAFEAESSFDMSCRRECLWQIADAVEYMHSMDIAHRDLHSKNVPSQDFWPLRMAIKPCARCL